MNDEVPAATDDVPTEPTSAPESTGVPRVDAVVEEVTGLADRPVEEHVAVFESAHEELRRVLDSPPDDLA